MNIDDMPAGREMDALVAEKVMGLRLLALADRGTPELAMKPNAVRIGDGFMGIPRYSTDIAAAWEVVEIISRQHPGCGIGGSFANRFVLRIHNHEPLMYAVTFCYAGHANDSYGDTAPLAICRAALLCCVKDGKIAVGM